MDAFHHAPLHLFPKLRVDKGLHLKPAAIVPFAKGSVQHFVFVDELAGRTLVSEPFCEGPVEPNGFQQLAISVTVDVLKPPVFEVKLPAAFFNPFEVRTFAQSLSATIVGLERPIQSALPVGQHLPDQPIVVPRRPSPISLPLEVMTLLENLATRQVTFFQAVQDASVVVDQCGQFSLGPKQRPSPLTKRWSRSFLLGVSFELKFHVTVAA